MMSYNSPPENYRQGQNCPGCGARITRPAECDYCGRPSELEAYRRAYGLTDPKKTFKPRTVLK